MIVNDDARIVNKLDASLMDDARVFIYNRQMFIVQATEADCINFKQDFFMVKQHYVLLLQGQQWKCFKNDRGKWNRNQLQHDFMASNS